MLSSNWATFPLTIFKNVFHGWLLQWIASHRRKPSVPRFKCLTVPEWARSIMRAWSYKSRRKLRIKKRMILVKQVNIDSFIRAKPCSQTKSLYWLVKNRIPSSWIMKNPIINPQSCLATAHVDRVDMLFFTFLTDIMNYCTVDSYSIHL